MTIIASAIISRVRNQLIDNNSIKRWTDAELLNWLTDGARTVVAAAPGAASVTATFPLVAGSKQFIPTDGHMLLNIVCNTSADGSTPGRAVRIISREVLDTQRPLWHSETQDPVVRNYVFDSDEPTKFYVYPPNDGTGFVEGVYAKLPAELVTQDDTIPIQPVYQTALMDYVLFRSHQKDSDFAAGQALAAVYLQSFMAALQSGEIAQTKDSPNTRLTPADPDTRGA